MRQNGNHKRPRNRGNLGRKPSNNRNQTFDSNGPSVRIRGNAFQVHEKYLTLARDAYSSGDRVMAENYFQHAEHYYRIVNANADQAQRLNGHGLNGHHGYDDDEDEGDIDQPYQMRQQSRQQGEGRQGEGRQSEGRQGEGRQGEGRQSEGRQGGERERDRDRDRDRDGFGDGRRRDRHANGQSVAEAPPAAQPADAHQGEMPLDGGAMTAPAANGDGSDGAAAEQSADAPEKPRRRPRRRAPAAAAQTAEATGRDGDEVDPAAV
ncbi:MAG: DUF4167 domain-containing protein [Alphaproteobacteria bacterium]